MKTDGQNCHYNYYKNCAECEKTSLYFPFNMLAISCHGNGGGYLSFDIFMWEGNSRDLAPQEITQWLPSLCYVVHQQLLSGNNGLYTVVVDTISLSYHIGGLCVKSSNGGIKEGIEKILHFPRRWR